MSRIIGGRARGRRLKAPRGAETRPTGDRVKQTLFDILAPEISGCRFLDPFAGGGGVGFEALSRGATSAVLVDHSPAAVAAIIPAPSSTASSASGSTTEQPVASA